MRHDRTPVREALQRHLDAGSTGRLVVTDSRWERVEIYVMEGSILAAAATDDDEQILRRLVARGDLTRQEAHAVRQEAGEEPLQYHLLDVVELERFDEVQAERFRQNVARYLSSSGRPEFEPLESILMPNIRTGHDTQALIRDTLELLEHTAPIRDALARGATVEMLPGASVQGDAEQRILALVGLGYSAEEILQSSPFEPLDTLEILADLVERGAVRLAFPEAEAEPLELPIADLQDIGPDQEVAEAELSMFADHDTVRGSGGSGQFVKADEELDRVDLSNVIDLPLRQRGDDPSEPIPLGEDTGEHDGDAPVQRLQMKFTGPILTPEEVGSKVGVINEVLRVLAAAFDQDGGPGAGQARIQLLLEGAPSPYSVLFYRVEAGEDGTLDPSAILHNLRRKPPTEHRLLLRRGLLDLVERALSAVVESLDDESIDRVLEEIAGYQQRLGL